MEIYKTIIMTFVVALMPSCNSMEKHIHRSIASSCILARTYIDLPSEAAGGIYSRISPDGRYFLTNVAGDVVILEIEGSEIVRVIKTPMAGETYPVEGDRKTWDFFASPNHSNGMRYYRWSDVRGRERNAESSFSDSEHNGFYHSSAWLPGRGTPLSKRSFRTMLYGGAYRDYQVRTNSDGVVKVEPSPIRKYCENGFVGMQGEVSNRPQLERELRNLEDRLREHEERRVAIIQRLSGVSEEKREVLASQWREEFAAENSELGYRARSIRMELGIESAYNFSSDFIDQPILSKDGTEFSGRRNVFTRIYRLTSDGRCQETDNVGFQTSKSSFSYPENGRAKRLAFSSHNRIYVYDRDLKRSFLMHDDQSPDFGGYSSYPNFTVDGRLIFQANINGTDKIVIVDPNQLAPELGPCIGGDEAGKSILEDRAVQ